ncbi:hypothetical protein [Clostridium beijerinckii]|uniref:hypothetical protein n=1 Tax=Clostridium beijerinckii TaxID=1520 RepID=UPI00098C8A23|nr:hypothetical protein [Clostridium beijerinckii]NRT78137.1 hypothetical protein [Clostridium beijerinckii]OOM44783.1 hypothetical protein CBEIJ_35290 [Clostridium beijerinckii]
MSKLASKEIKELLKNISEVMNDYEQYEIENGDAWGYVLKLNKNKDIELRIYDEIECENCNYVITIPSDVTCIKDILKGFINYIYNNEINWRNNCLKSNKGWYSRKHMSTNLWLERGKEDKVLEIAREISERYRNSKLIESQIEHYKVFISRLYYVLNCLVENWKIEDIKEAAFKRLNEFNIKNVGISHIDNKLIIMKSSNDSSYITDKFDIEIDSYTNISMAVNQIVSRLRKVA